MSNDRRIWDFLLSKIGNPCGVAGLMGNLYAESGLNPINLQNTYERKLGLTDEAYTSCACPSCAQQIKCASVRAFPKRETDHAFAFQ